MTQTHVITGRPEIEQALGDQSLIPHAHPHDSSSATMRLRAAMARFSGPNEHPMRRIAVEHAIQSLDIAAVVAAASTATRILVDDEPSAQTVQAVIRSVPTVSVSAALGAATAASRIVDDVETIVSVIGRGEPSTSSSDEATHRLLDRFAGHPDGAVAAVSVLYQNFDATSALIRKLLEARTTRRTAAPAVAATRRVTTTAVWIDGVTITAGSELTLMIGAAGLPFGAGPHACPGRVLATALAEGIVDELTK
jgi:hypothetical protein